MIDWFGKYEVARTRKGPAIDLVNDTEVLACWLFDIPTKQRDASDKVIEITDSINKTKDKMQVLEDKISLIINDEVDDKGKPKFSNQSIRDSEMRKRLYIHPDYLVLKNVFNNLQIDLGKSKSEVDYWGTMFSAVKNEVYHRRRVEELDSMKDLSEKKAKSILSEE